MSKQFMCIKTYDNTKRQKYYLNKIPPLNKGIIYDETYIKNYYNIIYYQDDYIIPLEEFRNQQIDKILENE